MRLLNTKTYRFEQFATADVPPYAILSHTWAKDEVSFKDMEHGLSDLVRAKAGFRKIELTCIQARADEPSLDYAWIDTCCIDKSSSAELFEAINSMFRWYASAEVCYAYISDFKASQKAEMFEPPFFQTRWWSRGWTLQELIAPKAVIFYDHDWKVSASKIELAKCISVNIGIPIAVSMDRDSLEDYSVAQRMSWASTRKTTRVEDLAYCLLGIFDVNISLIYGEGAKSFLRLQEEILRETDDQSIFAWKIPDAESDAPSGLFAPSPSAFKESNHIYSFRNWTQLSTATTTSSGLSISLPLTKEVNYRVQARLNCAFSDRHGDMVTLTLTRIPGSRECYTRVATNHLGKISWVEDGMPKVRQVHILQKPPTPKPGNLSLLCSFRLTVILGKDQKCNHFELSTSNKPSFPWERESDRLQECFTEHVWPYEFASRPYSGDFGVYTMWYKYLPKYAHKSPDVAEKQENIYFVLSIRAGGQSGDMEVACGSFEYFDNYTDSQEESKYVAAALKHQGILSHGGALQLIDTRTGIVVVAKSSVDHTGCDSTVDIYVSEETIRPRLAGR